jgi:hypothetical protein
MKVGDAVDYDAGDQGPSFLALVAKVHSPHMLDIAWMDGSTGSWHTANSVPERAEGGGVTWRHLSGA